MEELQNLSNEELIELYKAFDEFLKSLNSTVAEEEK